CVAEDESGQEAAKERTDDPDDDVAENAEATALDHAAGKRTGQTADDNPSDDANRRDDCCKYHNVHHVQSFLNLAGTAVCCLNSLVSTRQPGNSPTAGCLLNACSKNVAYGWAA